KVRRIEPHDAHEIDPFPTRLGDAARGVDAAAVAIKQQRRHHARVERWLAPLRSIGARDLDEIQLFFHQVYHEVGEVILGHEVLHGWRQKLRLVDVPGAKCLAHDASQNLTRDSLASKTSLLSDYYSDTLLDR